MSDDAQRRIRDAIRIADRANQLVSYSRPPWTAENTREALALVAVAALYLQLAANAIANRRVDKPAEP